MAINFPSGFTITSQDPIDTRLSLTMTEMAAMKKAQMPEVYLCICKDNGKLYLYNEDNEVDSSTGRFRIFEGSNADSIEAITNDEIDTLLANLSSSNET